MPRKKQIEDRAEDLGKEVGGYIFKEAFGALADVIKDAFNSSDDDDEESERNIPKASPKPKKSSPKTGKKKK